MGRVLFRVNGVIAFSKIELFKCLLIKGHIKQASTILAETITPESLTALFIPQISEKF